jgi:hypothetical protein
MFPEIPDLFAGLQAALSGLIQVITLGLRSLISLLAANVVLVMYVLAGIAFLWLIYLLITRLLGFRAR